MPVKRTTPNKVIRAYIENRIKAFQEVVIGNLEYIGERALTQARTGHRYQDQTGNLTSSIGYAIVVEGRVHKRSSFEVVKGGDEGAKQGELFLKSLISQHSKGIVFIMVAGMPYAQYVEAMSLDVLESAEMMAEKMLPQIFKALKL